MSAQPKIFRDIHPLLRERRSSKNMDSSRLVGKDEQRLLFEAARWAPSSSNLQPWMYIVCDMNHPEALQRAHECLNPDNEWAKRAPMLIIAVARLNRPNGRPNNKALHDLGLANENLILQAIASGLHVRPMGGFDVAKAQEIFHIPVDYQPVVVLAVGYPQDPKLLPAEIQETELQTRIRRPISEFVFRGDWNMPFREDTGQ